MKRLLALMVVLAVTLVACSPELSVVPPTPEPTAAPEG